VPAAVLCAATVVARSLGSDAWILGLSAAAALVLAVRRGTVVHLTADAIVVDSKGKQRVFPWNTILEASWAYQSYGHYGPLLRVRGGAFDEPGPVMPAVVGSIFLPPKSAAQAFAAACAAHGVPYTPNLVRVLQQGRSPRLATDQSRQSHS
jgi:hypothetical protein